MPRISKDAPIAGVQAGLAAVEVDQVAQDAAIAALTTATQDALDLKANTNDLATVATTGDYDDLAGIPSTFAPAAHDQAASTITGLATVAASGVYADLSAKPAIPFGFTYDQTAEPTPTTEGQTWRERSAGGLILGQWTWNGTLWLGPKQQCFHSSATGTDTTGSIQRTNPITNNTGLILVERGHVKYRTTLAHDASNHYRVGEVGFFVLLDGSAGQFGVMSPAPRSDTINPGTDFVLIDLPVINTVVDLTTYLNYRLRMDATGTPPGTIRFHIWYDYYRIRN